MSIPVRSHQASSRPNGQEAPDELSSPSASTTAVRSLQTDPREVPAEATARSWLAVLSLSLGAFVLVTSEFIPVGLLPRVTRSLHVSLGAGGLMVLVPALGAAISAWALYAGARSIDRRLLVAVFGSLVVVSNALAAIAPTYAVVIAARVFLGIAIGGFWSVVPPIGPRLVGQVRSAKATAVIVAGVSAGTVVGLPAGQFLGNEVGWRWSFGIAALVALLAIFTEMVLLPAVEALARAQLRQLVNVVHNRSTRVGLIVTATVFVGQFAASTYVTPFLLYHGRVATGTVTLLLVAYGAAGMVGTLLGGLLVTRSRFWTWSSASFGTGVVLITLASLGHARPAIGVAIVLWGLLWGAVPLSSQVWLLSSAPHEQEPAASLGVTTMQISIALGAALGGLLVDSAGLTAVFDVAGSVAVVAAVIARALGQEDRQLL